MAQNNMWSHGQQLVSEQDIDAQHELLAALADPTRLLILHILREREWCVTDIIKRTNGVSQPNVSKHLRALYAADLVGRDKRGREVFYKLAAGVEEFLAGLHRWQQRYEALDEGLADASPGPPPDEAAKTRRHEQAPEALTGVRNTALHGK